MKIRLLMPSVDHKSRLQHSVSVLIDQYIAIDTGGLPYLGCIDAQRAIDHVLLTHSHIDHIGGLPLFLDNIYAPTPECPTVYAGEATWNCLENHLFNDQVWPDLERIAGTEFPFYRKQIIDAHRPLKVADYQVTPIPLEHIVPTLGYVFESASGSALFAWDTAPFLEFDKIVQSIPNLKIIFLDASFPNQMQWLAEKSLHTTPGQFKRQIEHVAPDVRIVAVHLKPGFHDQVCEELKSLGIPNVEVASRDAVYEI